MVHLKTKNYLYILKRVYYTFMDREIELSLTKISKSLKRFLNLSLFNLVHSCYIHSSSLSIKHYLSWNQNCFSNRFAKLACWLAGYFLVSNNQIRMSLVLLSPGLLSVFLHLSWNMLYSAALYATYRLLSTLCKAWWGGMSVKNNIPYTMVV